MKKGKTVIIPIIISVSVILFLSFIVNILFKIKTNGLFAAEWTAGDALGYLGTAIGSIGTIALGYVAYKQNDRLHLLEKNNYISNNSSMLYVNEFSVGELKTPVNLNLHCEQIVAEQDFDSAKRTVGFDITITALPKGETFPAFIHVFKCSIYPIGTTKNDFAFEAKEYDKTYSRIAIGTENIKFSVLFLIGNNNRSSYNNLKNYQGKVGIELEYDIVSNKYVVTHCKCRAEGMFQMKQGMLSFTCEDPIVFFYGNDIVESKNIETERI